METDDLEALNVFIDSSVFIGKNYQYEHPSFLALRDSVSKGRVNVLITDVTIEEVKAHIKEDISSSIQALKKVRGNAKILRNLPELNVYAIFQDIEGISIEIQLFKQFDDFLSGLDATVVSISDANTRFVFDCYFKCAPSIWGRKKEK
jgi:hypothetical protein